MGLTKAEIFTEEQNRMATMLKGLAHPARMQKYAPGIYLLRTSDGKVLKLVRG